MLKQESSNKEKEEGKAMKKKSSLGISCLVFLGLVIIVCFIIFNSSPSQKTQPSSIETQPSSIVLNVSVNFTGTQFIIKNNDNFDWLNIVMEVDGSLLKGGFILTTDRMKAGKTYTVGALQFVNIEDGTRFDPFTFKPQKFGISCDTSKGKVNFPHFFGQKIV